jgi:HAD superfamily hydrolase (TIGR01450 family)
LRAVVCDLDGVVYLGDSVIDGVPVALHRLADAGSRVLFVTNNASRTPAQVATKITRLTGHETSADDVCTSSQAAERMLRPADLPVLVVGDIGITSVLEAAGRPMTDDPGRAGSLMVGLTRALDYELIAAAASAVRAGARFIATNVDPTYPTAQGLMPGAGSIVAAIAVAGGVEPEIAGKPHGPMRDLVRSRIDDGAWVVGDRVDTDVAMALHEPDWTSILVLTGVSTESEGPAADHVVPDLAAAVDLILRR